MTGTDVFSVGRNVWGFEDIVGAVQQLKKAMFD